MGNGQVEFFGDPKFTFRANYRPFISSWTRRRARDGLSKYYYQWKTERRALGVSDDDAGHLSIKVHVVITRVILYTGPSGG